MPQQVRCPRCEKMTKYEGNPFRPFCSEACKHRDLGAWASGEYAIAGKHLEVEEDNVSTEEREPDERLH